MGQHKIRYSALMKRFTLLFRLVKEYRQELVNGNALMISAKAMILFQEGIEVDHLDNDEMTPLFQALLKQLTDMESTTEPSVAKDRGKGSSNLKEDRVNKQENKGKKQDAEENKSTMRRGSTATEYVRLKEEFLQNAISNNYGKVSLESNLVGEIQWDDKRLTHNKQFVYKATISQCHKCHVSTEGKAHIPHWPPYPCNKCKYFGHTTGNCAHKPALNGVLAIK